MEGSKNCPLRRVRSRRITCLNFQQLTVKYHWPSRMIPHQRGRCRVDQRHQVIDFGTWKGRRLTGKARATGKFAFECIFCNAVIGHQYVAGLRETSMTRTYCNCSSFARRVASRVIWERRLSCRSVTVARFLHQELSGASKINHERTFPYWLTESTETINVTLGDLFLMIGDRMRCRLMQMVWATSFK